MLAWLGEAGAQPLPAVARRLLRLRPPLVGATAHLERPVTELPRVWTEAGYAGVVAPFWWRDPWVIVDLETTGMAPGRGAAITEVCAWRVLGDRVVGRFQSLVDPGHPIPRHIQRITGITDAMVSGAPSFAELAPDLAAFVGRSPWLAHNQRFDASFLDHFLVRAGLDGFAGTRICTLRLARRLLRGGRHNLAACVVRTGVTASPRHRAEADVDATHRMAFALLHHVPTEVTGWEALAEWLGPHR